MRGGEVGRNGKGKRNGKRRRKRKEWCGSTVWGVGRGERKREREMR